MNPRAFQNWVTASRNQPTVASSPLKQIYRCFAGDHSQSCSYELTIPVFNPGAALSGYSDSNRDSPAPKAGGLTKLTPYPVVRLELRYGPPFPLPLFTATHAHLGQVSFLRNRRSILPLGSPAGSKDWPLNHLIYVDSRGIEPRTSSLSGMRSDQLS